LTGVFVERNPYAPPAGNVADVEATVPRVRPWQVKSALWLLCLSIALSVPEIVYDFLYRRSAFGSPGADIIAMTIGLVIMLGLASLVSASIWKGWRWGRILYAVVVVMGAISAFEAVPRWFLRSPYLGVADLLSTLADVAAIALLFMPAANAWFRNQPRG